MYQGVISVIEESGLWQGVQRDSHAFQPSRDAFKVSREQYNELRRLGIALYDCQKGLGLIAGIAFNSEMNLGGVWHEIRLMLTAGVPKIYRGFENVRISNIPTITKLDLMVDEDGRFKIAEIDGHNKHGLGYSTLASRIREVTQPTSQKPQATVAMICKNLKDRGVEKIGLIFSEKDRFYYPEFQIAAHEFSQHGVICTIYRESELTGKNVPEDVVLDIPQFEKNPEVIQELLKRYAEKNLDCLIPPKPFYGAKGVMAILRNDIGNSQLESLLKTFIKEESLTLLRSYIPVTYCVGSGKLAISQNALKVYPKSIVLKESISSGMKGTYFSSDEDFSKAVDEAVRSRNGWVAQEEIVNRSHTFSYYNRDGGELMEEGWYLRCTAHFIQRDLADLIVTARQDKAVHGAKDCLQLGTVIVG